MILLYSQILVTEAMFENWESALDAYNKALKLDPTNSDLVRKFNRIKTNL